MTKLYGKEPVFVYDPYNSVNRPVRGVHDNVIAFWPIYPTTLQGMFVRAFTDGLKRPLHRIGEVPWRQELVRLRNSLMYCECGMENFYDLVKVRTRQGNSSCWSCGKALKIPPRIRIGNEIVMLNRDTKLFSYHLRPNDTHDFRRVIGQVVPHPTLKDVFGLKNLTQSSWKVRTHSGVTREVSFGKSISIETGAIVDFGNIKGEIRKG